MDTKKLLEIITQQVDSLDAKLMLLVNAGSRAYGIKTEQSDVDVRGIYYTPNDLLFCLNSKTSYSGFFELDGKTVDFNLFSLPEFIRLAMKNNVNILEWIFVDEQDVLYCDKLGEVLLENNRLFLSKEIYKKALGICKGYQRDFDKALEKKDSKKLGKEMAHIIRVHYMVIEALNTQNMHVHLFNIVPVLMGIRKGKYIKENCKVDVLYYVLLEDLSYRLKDAYKYSKLPETVTKECLKPLSEKMMKLLIEDCYEQ